MHKLSLRVCYLLLILILVGCYYKPPRPAPPRNFPVSDLVIGLEQMPAGWYVFEHVRPSDEKYAQLDSAYIELDARVKYGGIAFHKIYRFPNDLQASLRFDSRVEDTYLPPPHTINGWDVPEELAAKSLVADAFKVACADSAVAIPSGRQRYCIAIARYEEYLSILKSDIIDGYMSYADFARLIKFMDDRMAARLSPDVPLPSRTP